MVEDFLGNPAPPELWHVFLAAMKAKRKLGNIKDRARELLAIGDFVDDRQAVLAILKNFEKEVKRHWPLCICPECGGKTQGFCDTCKAKGYLTHGENDSV